MSLDVSSVAHELDRLVANPHLRKLAVVVPLDSGKREMACDYVHVAGRSATGRLRDRRDPTGRYRGPDGIRVG